MATEVNSPMFLVCGTPTYVAPEILDETGYVPWLGLLLPSLFICILYFNIHTLDCARILSPSLGCSNMGWHYPTDKDHYLPNKY